MQRKLTPSMEDYLRIIHAVEAERGSVRIKDIARELAISMPSASIAIRNLEREGLVAHPRYDLVGLTGEGMAIARQIAYRHRILKQFLSDVLGIDNSIAEKDACRMEHIISRETLKSLIHFLDKSIGTGVTK